MRPEVFIVQDKHIQRKTKVKDYH